MIKISRLADYAVIILRSLALSDKDLMAASSLAQTTKLPEPTVGKTLKMLSKAGILVSVRGIKGGYKMVQTANEISLIEIISAVDGPVSLTDCTDGSGCSCDYINICKVKGGWCKVNNAVREVLMGITLQDMINTKSDYTTNQGEAVSG